MNPKMVLTAIAMAALVATPAFAQKSRMHRASVYPAPIVSSNAVIVSGQSVGVDPDRGIRSELMRDAAVYLGNE